MQRHFNVTFPLACPHCLTEMLASLDDVQAERTIRCSECGTPVELQAEDLALPTAIYAESEQSFFGIEF